MHELERERKLKKVLLASKKDPVFFIEHFCYNTNGKPYKLEPQQKLFLRDKSLYKILFCSRRSGKTLTMIADMLHKAFFRKNQQLALIAPTQEQAKTFSNVMSDMIMRSPMLQSSFVVNNKFDKQLSNSTRIKFGTSGAKSGKKEDSSLVGSGLNVLYLDETQSLDAEALSTIIPVISGQVGNSEMVFAGTPRGKSNFFYDNIMNSKQISEAYVNNGKPKPCPQNGKFSLHRFKITDLDENGNVAYSKAEYRLPIDELETVKSVIGEEKFRREYCLEFLDESSMPYYQQLINESGVCRAPNVFQSPLLSCGGVDFGKARNNSVLTVATLNELNQVWEAKYFYSWPLGTEYNKILHYLNRILPKRFPRLQNLAIDATGVGVALTENVEHNARYNVLDIKFSQPMKVTLVENTINNLESGYVTFYQDDTLIAEMHDYTRELTDNGRVVFEKGASDDYIDSFNLCNYAITDFVNNGKSLRNSFKSYNLQQKAFGKEYKKKARQKYGKYTNHKRRRY